jgi:hypothetical protein
MNTPDSVDSIFTGRRIPRFRSVRQSGRPRTSVPPETPATPDEPSLPAHGTMVRTKRLILAALRVWELKRGIRD